MMRWIQPLFLALVLTIAILVPFVSFADDTAVRENTLHVGSGYTYTTISGAIAEASEGDTVRVHAGTYHENLAIDVSIDLIGDGVDNTTINGSWNGNTIMVTADDVRIQGLNVTGSELADLGYGELPINMEQPKTAGIVVEADRCHITQCNITRNNGSAILMMGSYNSWIDNCSIYDNKREYTNPTVGLIIILDSTEIKMVDCKVEQIAGYDNLGIQVGYSQECTFNRIKVLQKSALYGDGIMLYDSDNNRIYNLFTRAHTSLQLRDDSNSNEILDCTFWIGTSYMVRFDGSHDNVLSGCHFRGINGHGMSMGDAYRNLIMLNEFHNIKKDAIVTVDAASNIIYGNDFRDVGGVGIYFNENEGDHPKGYNMVYCNNFIRIGEEGVIDESVGNEYDNGTIGNYWDIWTSPDLDSDGIVDYQYNVSGSSKRVDYYPSSSAFTDFEPFDVSTEPQGKFIELTTDKEEYYPNINVKITLKNTGTKTLTGTYPSFEIMTLGNQTIYGPSVVPTYIVNLTAGSSMQLGPWDQKLNNGSAAPPGDYYVYVKFDGLAEKVQIKLLATPSDNGTVLNTRTGVSFDSIPVAISEASDGDTLLVSEGIFVGNFILDKEVSLVGAGRDRTVLNGNGFKSVVKVEADNCSISNMTIQWGGTDVENSCIYVGGNNFDVTHCKLQGCANGITISYCDNAFVAHCDIVEGTTIALQIVESDGNVFEDLSLANYADGAIQMNTVTNTVFRTINTYGNNPNSIRIMANCHDVSFTGCVFIEAVDCISIHDSSDVTFESCSFQLNHRSLMVYSSPTILVLNSSFWHISGFAIETGYSEGQMSYLIIAGNDFISCNIAIRLESYSAQNEIHHNDLLDYTGDQAIDNGTNNCWDDGSEGNFWQGAENLTDSDGDGISDQPFTISGSAGAKDRYPLLDNATWDGVIKWNTSSEPDDVIYTIFTQTYKSDEGQILMDAMISPFKHGMIIEWYINGTLVETGSILNHSMEAGIYTITVILKDENGTLSETTFEVIVTGSSDGVGPDPDKEAIPFETWALIAVIIIAAIIVASVVIVVVNRKRLFGFDNNDHFDGPTDNEDSMPDGHYDKDIFTEDLGQDRSEGLEPEVELELPDLGPDAVDHIIELKEEAYEYILKDEELESEDLLIELENKYEAGDLSEDVYLRIKAELEVEEGEVSGE